MSGRPTAHGSRPRTSPWPVFVAFGLAVAEVGVLFGVLPLSVGGIVLLGASSAAAVAEAGYAASMWRPLAVIGGVFAGLGAVVWLLGAPAGGSVAAVARAPTVDGVAFRGAAILAAGAVLVACGTLGAHRRPLHSHD